MAEYIEREDILRQMRNSKADKPPYSNWDIAHDCCIDIAKNIPTANVVEVVRCKECLYKNEWANDGSYPDYNFCKHSGLWHLTDNHFCSYGIRKEGAEE